MHPARRKTVAKTNTKINPKKLVHVSLLIKKENANRNSSLPGKNAKGTVPLCTHAWPIRNPNMYLLDARSFIVLNYEKPPLVGCLSVFAPSLFE
jgi:hypothetical protein